ncbi:hypothetical protein BGHDH14_bgh01913 [Blumeria hordei DH14]|uniref:Uncharacterized protein n=1 Tax=Blumeria graminis f. sp. hordei (strain DH14) TaxID=546991 RepID=N1JMR1_BLUG1|nr:hypothetical protein BGHDH14_bgh01913 [Blumeria hordei DH14]
MSKSAAMKVAILAAKDSSYSCGPDRPNSNLQRPLLTKEVRTVHIAPSSPRNPLQPRDQNVAMRVQSKVPAATRGASGRMDHYDKQSKNSRPLAPSALSAPERSSNRAPLTPRIAGSNKPSGLGPRPLRGAPQPCVKANSNENTVFTPTSRSLNNVTPRSGSRRLRVDSASTTPGSLPGEATETSRSNVNVLSTEDTFSSFSASLVSDKQIPNKQTTSPSSFSRIGNIDSNLAKEKEARLSADRVKIVATPQSRSQVQSKSAISSFCYANGDYIPFIQPQLAASALGNLEERSVPKFFHANGVPDLSTSSAAYHPPPKSSSAHSVSSLMSAVKFSPHLSNNNYTSTFSRPASPSKLNQSSPVSQLGSPLVTSDFNSRLQSKSVIPLTVTPINEALRPLTQIDLTLNRHERSSSSETAGTQLKFNRTVHIENKIDVSLSNSQSSVNTIPRSDNICEFQSPLEQHNLSKSGNILEQQSELAANARRERKVLDLEITNSSLAAINRTLEREMRKQTAELRRYRRLSRSGRFNISRSTSLCTSLAPGDVEISASDLSDDNEESEEDTSDSQYDYSEEEINDTCSLSLSAIAESDLRHRKKDEKRLQHDLVKHQQLLFDSRKLNQTLKRCLGLTEDLIGKGRKALEHKVTLCDDELGGRVLTGEEVEEFEDEELSELGLQMLRDVRQAALGQNKITAI